MKAIISVLLLFVGIEIALFFFTGQGDSSSSLLQLVTDPSQITFNGTFFSGTNGFLTAVQILLLAFAAAAVVGGAFFVKQDTAVYSTLTAVMMTYTLSLVKLWQFAFAQITGMLAVEGVVSTQVIYSTNLVLAITIGCLFIPCIMIIIDWARSPG